MKVFIGSSIEQTKLVEWLTAFMLSNYRGKLEPAPWTQPWPGGRFTLEYLLQLVEETDAAVLFWTPDDKTWYRDVERQEPRDNLVFEAGLFIASHGRDRTQLMVPRYDADDNRAKVAVPSDVSGLTWNAYSWVDGEPEATGLPRVARSVCDRLVSLGPRLRRSRRFQFEGRAEVEQVMTFVGDWPVMHTDGIARLATAPSVREIDLLAAYRVGEIRRVLDSFRTRKDCRLRACFANVWDDTLLAAYQRKYHDRSGEQIRTGLIESITQLVGPCDVGAKGPNEISITNTRDAPTAQYEIRLTAQRITFSYYRIDDVAFIVPLEMRRAQNPPPLAWVVDKSTAPRTFDRYRWEYETMFGEALHVYP